MIIDDKGKLFAKVNIIDLLIICIVVGALAFVGPKFIASKTANPLVNKADKIVFEIYVEEIPYFAIEEIHIGDMIKDPVKNAVLGKVTKLEVNESISYGINDQGKWIKGPKEHYKSVIITGEGEGTISDGKTSVGAFIDNAEEFIGRGQEFRIGISSAYGRIKSFTKKG